MTKRLVAMLGDRPVPITLYPNEIYEHRDWHWLPPGQERQPPRTWCRYWNGLAWRVLNPEQARDHASGEKPLPDLKPTVGVRDHGGVGDGKADDTAALQASLAAASAKGGVVGIPEGRWVLTGVLSIRASKVVLKGAGAGKTVLVCPKSLSQIRKPDRNWSWSGGLIKSIC